MFPDKLVMGMEIRSKVCMFVHERIQALRNEHSGQYQNAAVCRVNAMKVRVTITIMSIIYLGSAQLYIQI